MAIGYECDTRFIPAHHQPALLIDLALSRGIDSHRLLRGTGLFYADIAEGRAKLSPEQFVTLIGNAQRLLDADDSSFLFGQRLLPGHYGEASHTLEHACTLHRHWSDCSAFARCSARCSRPACCSTTSRRTSTGSTVAAPDIYGSFWPKPA